MDAPTASPSEPETTRQPAPVTAGRKFWEAFRRVLVVVLGIFLGAILALFIALSAGWISVGC